MEADPNYGPITIHPKSYLFFPTPKEEKSQQGKKGSRFFFYGQIAHDEYEKKKIGQFYDYVAKNKIQYDREYFHDQRLLLFLQGNGYKPKQTLQAMNNNLTFLKEVLPIPFQKVEKLVRQGVLYPCGRDKNFRPILVFNATLVDSKDIQPGFLACCYVQQLIIKNTFLPGQVESWIVIYDLGKMGVSQVPVSALKSSAQRSSLHYGGKLCKMFTVNAPGTIYFTWKIISAFLDPVTVQKIKISKTNTEKTLFDNVDPSQVQQKFGGTQPNRTQFWPFKIPDAVYDQKRLISLEEYEARLKRGDLKRNTINPIFTEKKEEQA